MDRIDKLFASNGILTRSECKREVRKGNIKVDGKVISSTSIKVSDENVVTYLDNVIHFSKFIYIMLNKPKGYVSSTEEKGEKTVLDLVPEEFFRKGLFPCGRLDKDTFGLLIITNDGDSAHRRLSPKSQTEKVYYFELADPIREEVIKKIENGIELKDGYKTKECEIKLINETSGRITIREGKYHEIRRIFGAVGNKVLTLKRESFGGIKLDENLKEGNCRLLTEDEIKLFCK